MVDLSTNYLGMNLKNPLVAAASPLSKKLDTVRQLEDSGISAIVMYSLFEEQIIHESLELDHYLNLGSESNPEVVDSYFPDIQYNNLGADAYLEHLQKVKKAVNVPIIASLNGVSAGSWISYAQKMQEAGADALELNLYYIPTDSNLTGSELEKSYIRLVENVSSHVKIPIAVKLSPFFTALPNFATALSKAGAKGLVLFNRFYQPDLDIESLEVVPSLDLSRSEDLRLPLRWIAILYGRVNVDFALTTGVHTAQDVLKCLMAGARVTQMASELLKDGPGRITGLLSEIKHWMEEHEYEAIKPAIGSMSQKAVDQPAAFERANYIKVLHSFDTRNL